MSKRPKIKQEDGTLVDLPLDAETLQGKKLEEIALKENVVDIVQENGEVVDDVEIESVSEIDVEYTDEIETESTSALELEFTNNAEIETVNSLEIEDVNSIDIGTSETFDATSDEQIPTSKAVSDLMASAGGGSNVVVWNSLATYYISYILSSDNSEIYTTNLTDEDISTLSMLDLSKNPIINGTEIIDMTGVQMVVSASLVLSGMQIGELGNPNSNLLTGVCTINNNNIYVTIDLVGKTITYKTLPVTKGTTTLVAECTLGTLISDNKYNFSCADYILNDFKNYDYIVMIINLDIGTIKLSSSVITGSTNDSIVVGRDELSAEIELHTETTGSITLQNIPSEYVSSFTIKAYKFD